MIREEPANPRPIYICGSTATGKTGISIALANRIGGEIVNADAYQIYRGLDTITAAPSEQELSLAPHHLFGVIEPTEDFDSQKYIDLARPVIAEIQSRGKIPIIVGGSGMYLKFLTHGPSPVPAGNDELRARLENSSNEELTAQLKELDPTGAEQTNLKNRRYVVRALEICILSGRPMSELKSDWEKSNAESEKHLRGVLLDWEREALRDRIRLRTQRMMSSGAIDEVASHKNLSTTCEKAIGVRYIQSYLKGEITSERCQELIYFATCQYAKRQRTWFNKEQWIQQIKMRHDINIKSLIKSILNLFQLD